MINSFLSCFSFGLLLYSCNAFWHSYPCLCWNDGSGDPVSTSSPLCWIYLVTYFMMHQKHNFLVHHDKKSMLNTLHFGVGPKYSLTTSNCWLLLITSKTHDVKFSWTQNCINHSLPYGKFVDVFENFVKCFNNVRGLKCSVQCSLY